MATPEEARKQYIEKMGEPLGVQFSALWQEVAFLHEKWTQFVELYGTRKERIDLLNNTAPHFFARLQDIFWENILLHIARLTDAMNALGRKDRSNLTIRNLAELNIAKEIAEELAKKIDDAITATEFARDWRNRLIAHRDLAIALDEAVRPISNASRLDVKNALRTIDEVMNFIEGHYANSATHYDGIATIGGALELLRTLRDGHVASIKREERIKNGQILEEDMPPDL